MSPNKPMAIVRMENRMGGMSLEIEQERFIGWGVTPSGPSICVHYIVDSEGFQIHAGE